MILLDEAAPGTRCVSCNKKAHGEITFANGGKQVVITLCNPCADLLETILADNREPEEE